MQPAKMDLLGTGVSHEKLASLGERGVLTPGSSYCRGMRPSLGINTTIARGSAMKLGLINSAWAQAGRDTAYGIRMTREIGFDTIDIFADPLDIGVKERRLIKRECDRVGLPIISLACVAVGLIDFNPSVQRFHLQRCRAYLDLAYEYEAKNVLLVLGEYIWEQQVI